MMSEGKIVYAYGMRLRPFAPGCQPVEGFVAADDDVLNDYHNILYYDHKLTHTECYEYDLDYLGTRRPRE